jgi:hypothetical protein
VLESLERLGGVSWQRNLPWDLEFLRAAFVLLLNRDLELKRLVLSGTPPTTVPFAAPKAEAFFMALDVEVVRPWLCDERLSRAHLVDKTQRHCIYLCR